MQKKSLIFVAMLALAVVFVLALWALKHRSIQPQAEPQLNHTAVAQKLSPSDRLIQTAQETIRRTPAQPQGYNMLCAAFMKKARETGDFSFNTKAEEALKRSFDVAPENYDAVKLKAQLLLTYHEFGAALEVARRAQQLRPQDYENYGVITDALVELGQYDEAIEAAQTMVDLHPGTASYSRASYLRALQGDTEGAIEVMRFAVDAAPSQDPESIAWCRVHLGDELMNAGRFAEAEREYDFALDAFPGYHLALAAKGRAHVASREFERAIDFYKQAQDRIPLPETAVALGDIYAKLGRMEEAKRQYQLVEFVESFGKGGGTYARHLAVFWADHDMKLDEALELAKIERAKRSDVYTCDALAWCLYKKGQLEAAKAAINEALRLGTRDARILYHAGMIHAKLGDRSRAVKYLEDALEINAMFDPLQADIARSALASNRN